MKKVLFLMVGILAMGLVFAGCSEIGNIIVPDGESGCVNCLSRALPEVTTTCIDFESTGLNVGDSIEELLIDDLLNIKLNGSDGKGLMLVEEGASIANGYAYLAYRTNLGGTNNVGNGCLGGTYAFATGHVDNWPTQTLAPGDEIVFSFPAGVTVSYFSIDMFDYGDWYPVGSGDPSVELTDNNGNVSVYAFPTSTSTDYDACGGNNGTRTMEISQPGMTEITLSFSGKMDPGVAFDNVCFTVEPTEVPFDIKPTSCPNPINTKSNGVIPVAILGTEDFDVTQIDPTTLEILGVQPSTWAYEDVATPFDPDGYAGDICVACSTDGPDGYTDLTLKFDAAELIPYIEEQAGLTIEMTELTDLDAIIVDIDGLCIPISITGNLLEEFGGTPIYGEDVVKILKKGK